MDIAMNNAKTTGNNGKHDDEWLILILNGLQLRRRCQLVFNETIGERSASWWMKNKQNPEEYTNFRRICVNEKIRAPEHPPHPLDYISY